MKQATPGTTPLKPGEFAHGQQPAARRLRWISLEFDVAYRWATVRLPPRSFTGKIRGAGRNA